MNEPAGNTDTGLSKPVFGFWIYLMTDCVLFASLFATFAVLHNNTFGGPGAATLFSLPYALTETLILLTSSFSMGLAMLAMHRRQKNSVLVWLAATFLLGIIFLLLEVNEFHHLAVAGDSWRRSGFLSAFFTLVGTHGLHITSGLVWIGLMRVRIAKHGLSAVNIRRMTMLSLFWHFLDVVWIFIFSIVYLMGAL